MKKKRVKKVVLVGVFVFSFLGNGWAQEENEIEGNYEEETQEEVAPGEVRRETLPMPEEGSSFQSAIIEGVQLTSEPTSVPDEKIVSGYFIFRDKPTSYFYEVKLKEKKLIFEFNDTRVGSSPVPSVSEPPIKGFIIEQGKIDVNKAVKGLKPEWHDFIRVVFDLEAVPEIHVSDEYSIISFSFKWTTNPDKIDKYIVKDNTPKIILFSSASVGGLAFGAITYFLLRRPPEPQELEPLDISDLPIHQDPSLSSSP